MAEEPTLSQNITGDYNAGAQGGGNATVNVTNIYSGNASQISLAYRGILGLPPPTDIRTIEQRAPIVKTIYARLLQPELNAIVLTGIGGVGKSTLAALIYQYCRAQNGTSSFTTPLIWLSVDQSTTFADVVGTLFQELGKPLPKLGSLSPSNQAAALFSLFDTQELSHLVVLDQFENLLDWTTGMALSNKAGVGEWLDALNSQCWKGSSRMLLTSRPRPKGTREFPPIYMQEYPVGGLTISEGLDLLRRREVNAPIQDLHSAVTFCNGHALSLTLLIALVQEFGISLTSLITDPTLWEGDIANNLLDAIFQKLEGTQRDALRACSIYRTPIPLESVSPLLGTSSIVEVQRTIRGLLTQHLIQRVEEGRYQVHAIVASYAKQHFVEGNQLANQKELQNAHTKAANFYLQQAKTFCPLKEQRRRVSEVQPLIEAVWHYTQAGQWQHAFDVIEQEELFGSLSLWGGNTLVLEISQMLLPRANWQPTPKQEAYIYLNLGGVYNVLGKKQEALDYCQRALTIYRELGDWRNEGVTLNNLGLVYDSLGKKQEALDYYQQALVIRREVGDRGGEGVTLNNLGQVYDSLGKKQEALDYYQQALTIYREVGDRLNEGVTLFNIGMSLLDKQLYNISLSAFYLAQQIFEEVLSPYKNNVLRSIDSLRQVIGEQQFDTLVAKVEPHAQQILEKFLN